MNLDVHNALGVSPVDWDTRLLAKTAAPLAGRSALDMGTGTGYLAIYLVLHGVPCDGVDKNPAAIRCAQENARRHGVAPSFFESDLFDKVQEGYDLIAFNPPYGNVGSARSTGLLEIVKSLLPKEHPVVRWIAYRLTRASRVRLIERFLRECRGYLNAEGRVLILLHESEVPLVVSFSVELMERRNEFRLLLLEPTGAL